MDIVRYSWFHSLFKILLGVHGSTTISSFYSRTLLFLFHLHPHREGYAGTRFLWGRLLVRRNEWRGRRLDHWGQRKIVAGDYDDRLQITSPYSFRVRRTKERE
ncbi:hypothetical protein K1719_017887 [Acacia pycnantha]|nr:hypothetical protein K1719_017887 [Acacia pycnantha]